MTPGTAQALLYNDIVPVAAVQSEHDQLRRVLALVAETIEVEDVLTEIAADPEGRAGLVERLLGRGHPAAESLLERWNTLTPMEVVRECVLGISRSPRRLKDLEPGATMLTPPLPNLYFTRDGGFVAGSRVFRSAMASPVRSAESGITDAVCAHLGMRVNRSVADFARREDSEPDSARLGDPAAVKLEGGDVLMLDPDCVLVGRGERSSIPAIDYVLEELTRSRNRPLTALVVDLPARRATIHLDMIATVIDRGLLLGYEPLVAGPSAAAVTRASIYPGREEWSMTRHASLMEALAAAGRPHELVSCGGSNPVTREREQWFSACNSVALAPGRVVVYRNNPATLEALSGSGFDILTASEAERDPERLTSHGGRVAVAVDGVELARGGGGPRCMTMPLERDPLPE